MTNNSMISEIEEMIDNSKTSINNNVDSVYSKVNSAQTSINSKISEVKTDTSSIISSLNNSTYGLSAIKNAFGNGSVKVVKSVQRGEITETQPETVNVTISSINTNKSILLFSTSVNTNFEPTNIDDLMSEISCHGKITSSTQLTFKTGAKASSGRAEMTISWQVIEFY